MGQGFRVTLWATSEFPLLDRSGNFEAQSEFLGSKIASIETDVLVPSTKSEISEFDSDVIVSHRNVPPATPLG